MRPIARLYNLLFFVSCWGVLLTFSAASQAAVPASASAGSVSLDQSAYSAHEDQGSLSFTIERTGDLSRTERVGYGVKRQDAQPGIDFHPISNTYITMAPGQATYTFSVPIIDQGMNATAVHAVAYLYGSWPDSLGANHNSLITILPDDPLQARDAADPLGVGGPINGNLIAGTKLYVDPQSPAAQAERAYARLSLRGPGCCVTSPQNPRGIASICGTWARTSKVKWRITWRALRSRSPEPQ